MGCLQYEFQILCRFDIFVHILEEFLWGNLRVSLSSLQIRMSQHLADGFYGHSCFQSNQRSEGMPCNVVNTSLSKRKRNIGGNMVTGCELVVFLCSAADRDRQNSMGY